MRKTRIHRSFTLALTLTLALVAGCLTVPLGDPEKSRVDPSYVGFWIAQRPDSDDGKLMAVLAYDARTYSIWQYDFKQTAEGLESGARTNFKAWLTPVKSETFITLERLDAARLMNPTGDKPYAVARMKREASTLTTRAIDPKFVDEQKVATSEGLEKMIAEHLENPGMYLDPEVYEKIGPERMQEVKDILRAFGEEHGE